MASPGLVAAPGRGSADPPTGRVLGPGRWYGAVRRRAAHGGLTLTDLVHDRPRRLPAHTHEHAYFSLLLAGGYREELAGHELDYAPLTVVYHPPGTRHRDALGPAGGRFLGIELDPTWLAEARAEGGPVRPGRAHPADALERPGAPDRGVLAWHALAIARAWREGGTWDWPWIEERVLAMLDAVVRPDPPPPAGRRPAWLATARDLLHARYGESVGVRAVAQAVGLHPVHVSRVFLRFEGTGVGAYVHRLRVAHVARALARGAAAPALADLAAEAGFADQAHMTRVFRRVTGLTPGEARRALIAAR